MTIRPGRSSTQGVTRAALDALLAAHPFVRDAVDAGLVDIRCERASVRGRDLRAVAQQPHEAVIESDRFGEGGGVHAEVLE